MEYRKERGIGVCGLACVLCRYADCPGCAANDQDGENSCGIRKCAAKKGIDGCYACPDYPCGNDWPLLENKRNKAFVRYAREFGKQALMERLRVNDQNGIVYHTPDKTSGDYDTPETEEEIYRLLRFGRDDPYANCPVYENEHFLLRLVSMDDAEVLLPCYSRPTDSVKANSFNCNYGYGSQTTEEMRDVIRMWLEVYRNRGYVRWSVVDKRTDRAVGTIELFNRQAADYFNNCGILRLDLCGEYEHAASIAEILSCLLAKAFEVFDCTMIATKTALAAKERMAALDALGFHPTDEQAAGENGARYDGFWVLERKCFHG